MKRILSSILLLTLAVLAGACSVKKFTENTTEPIPVEPIPIQTENEPTPELSKAPTPEPTATPTPTPTPLIDWLLEGNGLELPVNGASGYASVPLKLCESPGGSVISTLAPGQGFIIYEEAGDWWRISFEQSSGWVEHRTCMINLPDVIPSIQYDNSNAYASLFKSSGVELPDITGQKLYDSKQFNPRLGKDMFTMPTLYAMSFKICTAQRAALADGNTLIIYEAFRPLPVQKKVSAVLAALMDVNADVSAGINKSPWTIRWFIANGRSSHQQGCAIDVSLGKVFSQSQKASGSYGYNAPDDFEEYAMPTAMHELSAAAVAFALPVTPRVSDVWRSAAPAQTMNREALLLQKYCTDAGMTPLSSEWWHFDDVDCLYSESRGDYFLSQNFSETPKNAEQQK